ncbi:MAG: nucleotidyltransferase domain-containing protein, partial [Candidatus Omnitrophica bacterium]|nr:nucleotidyltransferase domain-containing protein [Candidatus Omnitrophota bacterium]
MTTPIDPPTHTEILSQLKRIEDDRSVSILYACESGSRA